MRVSTLASAAVLAASSAALVQVASTPVEQKTSADTGAGQGNIGVANDVAGNSIANNAPMADLPAAPREAKSSHRPRR